MCIRDRIGIVSGDIITSINGDPVADIKEFRQIIGRYEAGDTLEVAIERDGEAIILEAVLQEKPEGVSLQVL